jgi:hypothetical protein
MKNDQNWLFYEVKQQFREISYFDAIYVITSKVYKIHQLKKKIVEKVHF